MINKNVKIAKKLVKLAKNLVALDEEGDGSGFQVFHDIDNIGLSDEARIEEAKEKNALKKAADFCKEVAEDCIDDVCLRYANETRDVLSTDFDYLERNELELSLFVSLDNNDMFSRLFPEEYNQYYDDMMDYFVENESELLKRYNFKGEGLTSREFADKIFNEDTPEEITNEFEKYETAWLEDTQKDFEVVFHIVHYREDGGYCKIFACVGLSDEYGTILKELKKFQLVGEIADDSDSSPELEAKIRQLFNFN